MEILFEHQVDYTKNFNGWIDFIQQCRKQLPVKKTQLKTKLVQVAIITKPNHFILRTTACQNMVGFKEQIILN